MDQMFRPEEIFSVFFYNSLDYCSISNLDTGVFLEVNEAFERLTGWPRDEVIGKSALDINLWVNTADRREMADRVHREGFIHFDKVVMRNREGRQFECTSSMFKVDIEGQACLVAVLRDVSELRRAEEALRRLARGASEDSETFFDALVRDLAETLGVDCCFLGLLDQEDPGYIRASASFQRQVVQDDLRLELLGPAAETLFDAPVLICPDNAGERYPEFSLLAANGMRAFAAAPLFSHQGAPMGLLVVMGGRPFGSAEVVSPLMQVFAERAAAELERQRERAEARRSQDELLRQLADTRDRFEFQARELQSLLDASPLCMGVAVNRTWVMLNPAYERIMGYTVEESIGHGVERHYPSYEAYVDFGNRLYSAISDGSVSHLEVQYKRKNGELFWAHNFACLIDPREPAKGAIIIIEDISDRKADEQRIRYLAEHDQLTGLPNRGVLADRFEQARRQAVREGHKIGLLFLDLDHFKRINDTLGHSVGDAVLRGVVERVQASVRDIDTISRQGGDEFVILLPRVHSTEVVSIIAERIIASVSAPLVIDHHVIHTSFSIGVAFCPDDASDFETLMRRADIAMYQSKETGRNNYTFFAAGMNEAVRQRLEMHNALRGALDAGEFRLVYQPFYDLESGRMVGAEALLRWQSAKLGFVPPDAFIPLAEETGLIVSIGQWVVETAVRQAAQWQAMGMPLKVAVSRTCDRPMKA
ncbi:MAG TPA: diguanylate cyclase, partial [Rhodocyclaceae bacterium]|nr:diguanylate cyclase [Rhodocyclaceae bacterium]